MTVKSRITAIRLEDRIKKNKTYAEKIGVSIEMKNMKTVAKSNSETNEKEEF